jgi:hypothetical protein
MTRLKTAELDLFETRPPIVEMPASQRVMALSLITMLLTEALRRPAMPTADALVMEADHDKDHA